MRIERRNHPRIQTHLPSKLIETESAINHLGYVENLALEGAGFISPDYLCPNMQLVCQFYLQDSTYPIHIRSTLIHVRKDLGSFYYYGIKFDLINPEHRQMLINYIGASGTPFS